MIEGGEIPLAGKAITAQVIGDKAIVDMFQRLARGAARQCASKAARAAIKIQHSFIKAATPVGNRAYRTAKGGTHKPGTLAESMKVRVRRSKRSSGWVRMQVVTSDKGDGNLFTGEAFYGAFVEFGHKLGKRPGQSAEEQRLLSLAGHYRKLRKATGVGLIKLKEESLRRQATAVRERRKASDARRTVPGEHFMQINAESHEGVAMAEFRAVFATEVEKAAKSAAGVQDGSIS